MNPIFRFVRWLAGFDVADYWRRQAQAEARARRTDLELLTTSRDQVTNWWNDALKRVASLETELRRSRAETAQLRTQLNLEAGIRTLYEQVVIEAGEQIVKNTEMAPKTLLGVFRHVFAMAVATATEWREEGAPEQAEITNLRATMNSALLPEPDSKTQPICTCGHPFNDHPPIGRPSGRPCVSCKCDEYRSHRGIVTERKRDGRVGDSTRAARADREHLFDYGPTLSANCNLCGRRFEHGVHRPSHPQWQASR